MKRKLVVEKWSISDIVRTYTDKISEKIIKLSTEQLDNKQYKYSPITQTAYVEGKFEINTFDFGNDKMPPVLNVEYIMYDVHNANSYNNVIKKEDKGIVNSESDFKQNYIRIVSGYIGETLLPDFYGSISHEVEHIYQYACGMQKKIDLYDAVCNLYKDENVDKQNVGYTLYYTFKHEQDAMAHQFYEYLDTINIYSNNFENILEHFSEYMAFTKAINFIKKMDKDRLKTILNSIGFSIADYNKRIHYSFKRFVQKMHNAFNRKLYDMNERYKCTNIGYNMTNVMIMEECEKNIGYKLQEKIESIYEF